MRGGWVGFDVWDKVPKRNRFFTPSPIENGSLRLVKLVGHTGGSHKELSVTPLVTHGGSYRWDTEVEHTQDGQKYCWSQRWVIQVGGGSIHLHGTNGL